MTSIRVQPYRGPQSMNASGRTLGHGLRRSLYIAALAGTAFFPLAGSAQTAPDTTAKSAHPMLDRFEKANTTHDGHLTQAQAQSGNMPMVAKQFGAIDTDHKGYVTLQDVRQFMQARHADHKGQGSATPPG